MKRKTAFVPRLLVRTALMSVVPACALGCSDSASTGPGVTDTGIFGVAAVAYPAYETGTPDTKTDGTTDAKGDATGDTTTDSGGKDVFGVAAVAYPAYETGAPG